MHEFWKENEMQQESGESRTRMSLFEHYLTVWVFPCIIAGAALEIVIGVLIEVPVMLSVVYLVKRSKNWYETGAQG